MLVADNHPVFRDGLRLVLDATPGIELVGEAATGPKVVAAALALRPDVVIMDLQMPGLNGIEATREITANCPDTAVVVVTMVEEDESLVAALEAGARGYLLKESSRVNIVRAVEAVARKQAVSARLFLIKLGST